MSVEEYLKTLREHLRNIPASETDDIVEYYREYFAEAGTENQDAVMQELGTPQELAKRVTVDYAIKDVESAQKNMSQATEKAKKGCSSIWIIILAVCGFPIWFPLAIALGALAFVVIVVVYTFLFAILIAGAAMILAGGGALISGVVLVFQDITTAMVVGGSGVVCIGLGILFLLGVVQLFKLVRKCMIAIARKKISRTQG